MENIETGLLLMVVGMTTVFAILLIVINLGKGLIVLVNKYAPEEIIAKKPIGYKRPLQRKPSQSAVFPDRRQPPSYRQSAPLPVDTGKLSKLRKYK